MAIIEFSSVYKSYGPEVPVLRGLDVSVEHGEFITCIGPSGCGKTTFLKIINALLYPEDGSVQIYGKELKDWDPIELRRSIGYVIQQVGLFPHMTVRENIGYVLRIMKRQKNGRFRRAEELIELVGLSRSYLDRYPRELSGGQQQRVGVARALAADPEILLMDEPFGAVDEITRKTLQLEMKKLHEVLQKTIIFVTHDIEEAMRLGTRIALLNQGVIEQIDSREKMLFDPKTPFVESFFGSRNFSSFLNVEAVGSVYTPLGESNFTREEAGGLPSVDVNSPLIEGIKKVFDTGHEILAVTDWKEGEKERKGVRADRGDHKKSPNIPAAAGKRTGITGGGGNDGNDGDDGGSNGVYTIDADSIIGTFSLATIRSMFDTHLAEDTRYIRT
ncbi:MAG: ATP-binding cassette domain-containing protein [Spirochaetia bacterium]|nr:ATP-binding cassette domain-containing protein [Spirochaetia bacterium]